MPARGAGVVGVRSRVLVGISAPGAQAVAYFIVSEAITNVVKHAQATQAEVAVARGGDLLRIAVADNGVDGAVLGGTGDPDGGTGLRGLMQRVASVDGTLTMDSPPGGPTVIAVELPCECRRRRMVTDQTERKAAGPGGHSGATLTSSAAGPHPHTGTSDKPHPGPATRNPTTALPTAS